MFSEINFERGDYATFEAAKDFYALAMKICLPKEHNDAIMPNYYIDSIMEKLKFYFNSFNNYNNAKLHSINKNIINRCINCNRQPNIQKNWQLRMQSFWQQECRTFQVKNSINLFIVKNCFSVF